MKTLEQIKEELANEKGFEDYPEYLLQSTHSFGDLDDVINEVCDRYARECVKASLEKAAANAVSNDEEGMMYVEYSSIVNDDNIKLL